MEEGNVTDGLLRAGYASIEAAEAALGNLRRRRDEVIDRHISASSLGGSDFGGGLPAQQWRELNAGIDEAARLHEIEARIRELRLLIDTASATG